MLNDLEFTSFSSNFGAADYAGSLEMMTPVATPAGAAGKRCFDVSVALFMLSFGAPALLMIALTVKLTSRGPVLFRQPRVGLQGETFTCYKFRTMTDAAADLLAEQQTVPGDHRITAVGRWLRKLSFDELPQLINVLRGDMSLVGPRPHAPSTKAGGRLFAEVVPHYHRRHAVRPGITGLAQVSGCRGPTSHEEHIVARVRYDLIYISTMSPALDLKILWKTVTREIFSDNAF